MHGEPCSGERGPSPLASGAAFSGDRELPREHGGMCALMLGTPCGLTPALLDSDADDLGRSDKPLEEACELAGEVAALLGAELAATSETKLSPSGVAFVGGLCGEPGAKLAVASPAGHSWPQDAGGLGTTLLVSVLAAASDTKLSSLLSLSSMAPLSLISGIRRAGSAAP